MKRRPSKSKQAKSARRPAAIVPQPPIASATDLNEVTGREYLDRGIPYTCRKCGLSLEDKEDFRAVTRLPLLEDIHPDERWYECPDDGPTMWDLWDPEDHSHQRCRRSFVHDGRVIRVCTRNGRTPPFTGEDGKERFNFRGAMSPYEMRVAWSVKDYISKHGPAGTPELEVFESYRLGSHGPLRISRAAGGNWMVPVRLFQRFGTWIQRIIRSEHLGVTRSWIVNEGLLDRVAPLLSPLSERGRRSALQATLHVPIDLRLNLDQQWQALRPALRQTQNDLLAFCGRLRVYKPDEDTVTRDLYCYLLAKRAGMNASEIARDVFPDEKPGPAAAKVRKIVSDFGKALAEAGPSGRES